MSPTNSATPSETECGNVSLAARRLGLYGQDDGELEALIALYRTASLPADRWTMEAARFVRDLRARGDGRNLPVSKAEGTEWNVSTTPS
jgi:hypothetical protein